MAIILGDGGFNSCPHVEADKQDTKSPVVSSIQIGEKVSNFKRVMFQIHFKDLKTVISLYFVCKGCVNKRVKLGKLCFVQD